MSRRASRVRRLIDRHRSGRAGYNAEGEQGFTLIELLVVLVIMPLVIGAIAVVMITTFKASNPNDPEGTFARLADAHDAQITSAYFVRDVQSAQSVSTSNQRVCASPTDSTADQILGLSWSVGTTMYAVTYAIIGSTSPPELVRDLCIGGTYSNTSVVSHDVFKSVPAPGFFACPSPPDIGAGFSSCAGDAGTHTTYVATKVVCNDGSVTCAKNGLYPVTSTFTDGATTGSSTWTSQSAAFSAADQGKPINGAFIPSGTTISSITNSSTVVLSQSPTGGGTGLSFQLPKRGVSSVVMTIQESQSGFKYSLTGIPRRSNLGGGSATSAPFYPPFLANGNVDVGNCQFVINGVAAFNNGGNFTDVKGSVSDTGTYTAGISSPYSGLSEPPKAPTGASYFNASNPSGQYAGDYVVNTSNWDPSGDSTYLVPGSNPPALKPGIYVVTDGMDISKGLSTPQGVLFYVTGGSVTLGGSGNLDIKYLSTNWESPPTSPPPPTTPEPVLWISAKDKTPNPPVIKLEGNGNVISIDGAIYAPTAAMTMSGGGNSGGITASAFTVGTVSSCNGGGNHPDVVAGSPLSSGTVESPTNPNIMLGTANTDAIVVQGQGNLAPTGSVKVYVCGPYGSQSSCTNTTSGVQSLGSATLQTASGGTSSATSMSFTPTQAGTWCFAAYYQGDFSYNPSSDTTSDGCFTVTSPILPPSPSFTYPSSGACYYSSANKNPPKNCSLWTGPIAGTATDPTGPGITAVNLQIEAPDQEWWNGSTWSSTETVLTATLIGPSNGKWSWTYSFPSTSFESGKGNFGQGTYTVFASSTDSLGTSPQVSLAFTWSG